MTDYTWLAERIIIYPDVYDTPDKAPQDHAAFGAATCRLRSDGKMFFVCGGLKITNSRRVTTEQTFEYMLEEATTADSISLTEFFAAVDCERERLNGFYL